MDRRAVPDFSIIALRLPADQGFREGTLGVVVSVSGKGIRRVRADVVFREFSLAEQPLASVKYGREFACDGAADLMIPFHSAWATRLSAEEVTAPAEGGQLGYERNTWRTGTTPVLVLRVEHQADWIGDAGNPSLWIGPVYGLVKPGQKGR
jgi:hypothetical protein